MTRVDVADMNAKYAAATPGEWHYDKYEEDVTGGGDLIAACGYSPPRNAANGEWIAASRNAWPVIARELEAGRRLREVTAHIQHHETFCDAGAIRTLSDEGGPCNCDLSRLVAAVVDYDATTEEVQRG